jgi:pyruvate formate lyase activating enzyme
VTLLPHTGLVFDVQRFSVHDGPGIRTTVFLKGCPLACRWCHNPEGMRTAPEILVTPDRCIACRACAEACPHDLPSGIAGGWAESKDLCEACGLCAEACPTGARRLAGQVMTVRQLADEVTRDQVFYDRSGGGVTFSGGEPLSQADFVLACLRDLKERGFHTAVDTCGLVDRGALLEAAALSDLVLFDIKHADEEAHVEWAGAPNGRILANLEALARVHDAIWVRVPVVPGVNDDAANLRRTAALAASLPGVQRVSLLPYHELGEDKRERVGAPGASFATDPPPRDRMRDIATIFEEAGLLTVIGG